MPLLICIPTKTEVEYLDRAATCEATWLRHCPCDYQFFRDADYELDDTDPLVRQKRMKAMCGYALDCGYDYMFRVDSDAYVWVDRLLACGFEAHDYMGFCKVTDSPAFGSVGFFLSRRAMHLVVDGKHTVQAHGIYWGDLWTGELMRLNGIFCHSDERFRDGFGKTDWRPDEIPDDTISVHPVSLESQKDIHGQRNHANS